MWELKIYFEAAYLLHKDWGTLLHVNIKEHLSLMSSWGQYIFKNCIFGLTQKKNICIYIIVFFRPLMTEVLLSADEFPMGNNMYDLDVDANRTFLMHGGANCESPCGLSIYFNWCYKSSILDLNVHGTLLQKFQSFSTSVLNIRLALILFW